MKQNEIAVVGGGPAGLTATVYAIRAGYAVTVFEGTATGGQMLLAHEIENYSGFSRISGIDLADAMTAQASELGANIVSASVDRISPIDSGFSVTAGGETTSFPAVIVATGVRRRDLGVPGEDAFIGRGVSYCAVCDGRFFRGKHVAVVGGGNTALGDALYLARFCESVTVIHRRDTFRADQILVERLKNTPNIKTIMNARVEKIEGEMTVQALSLVSTTEGSLSAPMMLPVAGVFVAVGQIPDLPFLSDLSGLQMDAGGYIVTNDRMETSLPGLYAAGDVRAKSLRQIATAVADGAIAGVEATEYLKSHVPNNGVFV